MNIFQHMRFDDRRRCFWLLFLAFAAIYLAALAALAAALFFVYVLGMPAVKRL